MRLIVEDFLPYDQSSVWRLHDSYFAQCGAEAWTKGFIPYLATSSYAMARQHARMLVSLVAELGEAGVLDPTDEVRVLEVGSGLGRFAAHVARALAADCGDAGRALRERLRYVMSDYSRKNLTDAIEGGPLAELTRLGRVTPALFDLSKPHELHDLAGKALDGTFTAVFANYVCCALPPRIVRKTAEGVFEKLARVGLQEPDDDDSEDADKSAQERWAQLLENPTRQGLLSTVQLAYAWRALAPGQAFVDRLHQAAFEELTAPYREATVVYPIVFLDFARTIASRMVPGGALFISDFGSSVTADIAGLQDAIPTVYGNSFSHGLNFSVFDAFCHQAQLPLVRTKSSLLAVHRAAIRYGRPCSATFKAAFRRAHLRDGGGQVVLDLRAAAQALTKAGDHRGAVRLLRRSLSLDPEAADLYFLLGECCLEAGLASMGARYLRRGKQLDTRKLYDFDFVLGRIYFRLERYHAARRAFKRALKRQVQAATYINLGLTYERLRQPKRARTCYRRSLELTAEGDNANTARRRLCDLYQPRRADAGSNGK